MTTEDWKQEEEQEENFKDAVEIYDPNTGEYCGLAHRKTYECYSNAFKVYFQDEETKEVTSEPFIGPENAIKEKGLHF